MSTAASLNFSMPFQVKSSTSPNYLTFIISLEFSHSDRVATLVYSCSKYIKNYLNSYNAVFQEKGWEK